MEFDDVERIDISVREPTPAGGRTPVAAITNGASDTSSEISREGDRRSAPIQGTRPVANVHVRPSSNSTDGSPLDPKYTFETFVVGASNRMAHAAAIQVAEKVFSEDRAFNPLFLHSSVGLGKSHLLQAIAWEIKRRKPTANILYLTAERFRFDFVEALKSQQAMAFKDRFRNIDILLIDDLEFMQGDKTEQEFEHIINTLLDGGRQVVVASARPPAQIERLNDRMRSRLQRGLVTELGAFDAELRMEILKKRMLEKRASDPSFELPREVLDVLAERLQESGRELEGAVTRLFATWQLVRTPITMETVETVIRDLVQGIEPRRIKIEDILRVVSRHYAISKADILSQRRHRSVVWPRQIGMYLAKQLTARSLPEIGRRFGDRDHTTVLHAIRKIEKELDGNTRLRDELEELKKQINR
jgi:chromosomal replication initiator protein